MSLPIVDAPLCDGCRTCVEICPVGVYELREGKAVVIAPEDCTGCQACVPACMRNCIVVQD